MDLDALDTAYGAEQIDSDLLLTDIRTGLEYTLRNKTYCGQDPFGKRRYGADAGDKARICNSFIGSYEEVKPFIMSGSECYDQPYVKLAVDDHPWRDSGVELRMACLEGVRSRYWDTFIHKAANIGLMPANMEEDYKRRRAELKDYDLNDYTVRTVMEDIRRELRRGCTTSLLNLFDRLGSMGSRQRYDVYDYDADTLSSENTQKYCSFDKKQTSGFRLAFPKLSMYSYVFDCYRDDFNKEKAAHIQHGQEYLSCLHALSFGFPSASRR